MPNKYYAIVHGHNPGIYSDWPTAEKNIKGFPGAIFKSFRIRKDAEEFIKNSTLTPVKYNKIIYHTNPLPNKTIIYTDGSYGSNACGFGVVIITSFGEKITAHGRVPLSPTNNVGELYAIYVALSLVPKDVLLYSDSQYSISCLTTHIHDWMKNGWKNVSNRDLIEKIYEKMQGRSVEFQYVPAHNNIELNEEVDVLASRGRMGEKELIIIRNGIEHNSNDCK